MKNSLNMKRMRCFLLALPLLSAWAGAAADFTVARNGRAPGYRLEAAEAEVVRTAVEMFRGDLLSVTGARMEPAAPGERARVLIGTVGLNPAIEELARKGLVRLDDLRGEWEKFRIATVGDGGEEYLVVAGSDARGTAYGVLELSRLLGVSPWVWWADAQPAVRSEFTLPDGYQNVQQPSVQYRGIFINDEDWGLNPWSSMTYEPLGVKGSIGPRTYSRVFELLLRLRANTLWPAMHDCSVPFYFTPGNMEAADRYGIVIGTSHCEPLMRNNVGEWDAARYGDYNFRTNRRGVIDYWRERLEQVRGKENFYTVGMRGIHDSNMEGYKTLDEQTQGLNEVFEVQRGLLAEYIDPDASKVPQVFIPYKEVLAVYDNGVRLPEDVTLMWCDDNYGYITRLSSPEEQRRSGGGGVYYHLSYWGRPHDYLWLQSTQPALVYTEMKRAWDYNARKLWILNVGDIKPAEYGIEMFMDMAWNIAAFDCGNIGEHAAGWIGRTLGRDDAQELSRAMEEYYRLASVRKPEFMGWSRVEENGAPNAVRGRTPVVDTEFNPYEFGDEIETRLEAYRSLSDRVSEAVGGADAAPAGFETLLYPVRSAYLMNLKLLSAQKARLYAAHGLRAADEYAEASDRAYRQIGELAERYNTMLNGKWNRMVDPRPRNLFVFDPAELPEPVGGREGRAVWFEGDDAPMEGGRRSEPLVFDTPASSWFVNLFDNGGRLQWKVLGAPDWLQVEARPSERRYERRLDLTVRPGARPDLRPRRVRLAFGGEVYSFEVCYRGLTADCPVEEKGAVAWNAADARRLPADACVTRGLGHSGKALTLSAEPVSYEIYTSSVGEAELRACLVPSHPVNGGKIRYAVSVDGEPEQVVEFQTEFRSEQWKLNVLRNQSVRTTRHRLDRPGRHTVRVRALDPGVILDQMMLDFHPGRKFYVIPVK